MSVQSASDLFEHELQDIYFAEHELTSAYERMADQTEDKGVQKFFEEHVDETAGHIERLVEVFEETGEAPRPRSARGSRGCSPSGRSSSTEAETGPLLDYYNLVTAVKTERYEQSAYESLVDLAEHEGRSEAADLLRENLDEATLDDLVERVDEYDGFS